nr:unnamed protein product [Digitaria exilis]
MVCFLGLRVENVTRVSRATLPKHFLEDIGREGFEVVRGFKRVDDPAGYGGRFPEGIHRSGDGGGKGGEDGERALCWPAGNGG